MEIKKLIFSLMIVMGLLLSSCGGATPQPASSEAPVTTEAVTEPVTITVWDYYGEATPVKPLVAPFEASHPNIKIDYQSLDWDTTFEKLNVVLTGGTPPDVVTVDMTWIPGFASLNAFADLKTLGGGMLNGVPWDQAFTPGGLDAITFDGKIIAALYDFDTYALYYRSDLFEQKGIQVPSNWDELEAAAKSLAEGEKYLYEFDADTFHGSQWIYENGGELLNADNTQVVFNSPEAVEAITFNAKLLQEGVAIDWTEDQGERIQGVKDGRIAMFSDGPYYMGIMKSAAPEMAGMWKVALHPYSVQPGSYLGGTGLAIPSSASNQEAAWEFIQYAMELQNQIGVYTYAGAAPALTTALSSPEVNIEDPYFGGEKAFDVFLQTMKTATHFPYVSSWSDIDGYFTTAMQEIALGDKTVQQALDEAAASSQATLGQ
jgi:ABC-type glycerol-3-phosphate transport system substrate-binding protein